MRFEFPLFLFLFIPYLVILFYRAKKVDISTIRVSSVGSLLPIQERSTRIFSLLSRFLKYVILALMIIAMAKPQLVDSKQKISSEGIDILLVLDTSRSMAAEDMTPVNRLESAKSTIQEFVSKRHSDRIGLVVFGTDAYTMCPLTLDYSILTNFLSTVELSMAGDGTSIGMGLALGLKRLKESKTNSKIMILLTDGENNGGSIDPKRASKLAKDLGVRVYTIGVGKEGPVRIPYDHPVQGKTYLTQVSSLDEPALRAIANETNGQYFRSTDTKSLQEIYNKIDDLEKTEIKTEINQRYTELFPVFLTVIIVFIMLELALFHVLFVVTP
jgi:Ca-activated chloride channel family protein